MGTRHGLTARNGTVTGKKPVDPTPKRRKTTSIEKNLEKSLKLGRRSPSYRRAGDNRNKSAGFHAKASEHPSLAFNVPLKKGGSCRGGGERTDIARQILSGRMHSEEK